MKTWLLNKKKKKNKTFVELFDWNTLIYFLNSGHNAKTSTADVTKENVWNDVDKRDARQTDEKSATLNDNAFWTLNNPTKHENFIVKLYLHCSFSTIIIKY